MTSLPDSPPIPKPRNCYSRNSVSSAPLAPDRNDPDLFQTRTETWAGTSSRDQALPPLSLGGASDLIATHIPSLSGLALSLKASVPSTTQALPPETPSTANIAKSITANIPSLAVEANAVADCRVNSNLENVVSSFSDVQSLAGLVSNVANANSPKALHPSAPAPISITPGFKPGVTLGVTPGVTLGVTPGVTRGFTPEFTPGVTPGVTRGFTPEFTPGVTPGVARGFTPGFTPGVTPGVTPGFTDVSALSNLVQSVMKPAPNVSIQAKVEYLTLLSHWTSHEEAESESSNEDEEPAPPPPGRPIPSRPAPPPPRPPHQSQQPKSKIPRAATLRVSRKKEPASGPKSQGPSVTHSSWLDVWKGFRHSVVWSTFDGNVMALFKKRTDRFSEVLFHVSNITDVKKLDKGRFSVYFRKKHYDFMAHNNAVQEAWVSSLLSSRGCAAPAPPDHQGPLSLKDPRSRVYAVVLGSELWVFPNKDSFNLGIASFTVQLNVASVKSTGKHSFSLITPYKTFSLSADSSRDLSAWMETLSSCICSSLGNSQVVLRLWEHNPNTKLCSDCGAANPEWASVNLLLVICHTCAGAHRAQGKVSKIKSLTMDDKVWTEALIQLFICYGNRVANQIWAPVIPATEQLSPDSSEEQRSKFIQDKYSKGRFRRLHALSSTQDLMDQRLREVVCTDDVEETLSLICSGAKVTHTDLLTPSAIHLAEGAGQALQVELLRLNEYTEVPPPHPPSANESAGSTLSVEEEELHGKLEDDRFLFSMENDSAACDVLDLREVHSVFLVNIGSSPEFQCQTLSGSLVCAADSLQDLLVHYYHILKVILPPGVTDAEVGQTSAVSKVCVVEMGASSSQSDAWILLWVGGVSLYQKQQSLHMYPITRHEMDPSENTVTMETRDRSVTVRFEDQLSCNNWFTHLSQRTNESPALQPGANPNSFPNPLANQSPRPSPQANHSAALYPVKSVKGRVPVAIEHCISHITHHGLKVEGVYRRCGLANKVTRLVDALLTSPGSALLESEEQGVLDAAAALKRIVRQTHELVPERNMAHWIQAAVISDERSRFAAYKQLLKQLPDDNRATLSALFGHFYMVQVFSQVNRMSAQNLALVLVPTFFQTLNQDLVRLLREFIIHHTLLFLMGDGEEEEITFL